MLPATQAHSGSFRLGRRTLPLRSTRLLFQGLPGLLLLSAFGVLIASLSYSGDPLYEDFALTALFGLVLGAVFYRTRFCMFCMIRDAYEHRNTRPLLLLLTAIAVGSAGYLLIFGSWVPDPAAGWLPPNAFIGPVGWNLVAGGLIFGFGMAISGSCISSHIYRGAAGNGGSWIALAASVAGFTLGYLTWDFWYLRTIQEAPVIWLPAELGYAGAAALHFGFIGILSLLLYGHGRRSRSPRILPAPAGVPDLMRRLIHGRWNPWWGAAAVGIIGAAAYLRLRPLGVTSELSRAGRGLARQIGFIGQGIVRGLDAVAGCIPQEAGEYLSQNGVLLITIGAGSLIASLAAGQFRIIGVSVREALAQILGGLFLGYGAMISLGCSIGTFLSGTMALSLSGWVFAMFMSLGIIGGLRLLRRFGRTGGCDVPAGPPVASPAKGTDPAQPIVSSVRSELRRNPDTKPALQGFISPEKLRTAALESNWNDDDLLILHTEANRIFYESCHIPAARWFDLSWVYRDWKGKSNGGMYPDAISDHFNPRSFGGDRPVVLYDSGDGQRACRAAIALRLAGWSRVTVLDGGLRAWLQKDFGLAEDLGADFEALGTPEYQTEPAPAGAVAGRAPASEPEDIKAAVELITMDEVKAAVRRGNVRILDVRSADEYTSGSIPGALHREWSRSLGPDTVSLAPVQTLRSVWDPVTDGSERIIVYCRSAMRAAHSAWLLAGLYPDKKISLYDGSWREWSGRNGIPRFPA